MKRKAKTQRVRAQHRRRAHRAKKRARKQNLDHSRFQVIGSLVPGEPPHLFDDCPYCKALAAVGARPDADGVVALSPAQHEEYERQLAHFLATDGLPDGAVSYTAEQLQREFMQVAAEWAERGVFDGVENMTDAELDAITLGIIQTLRARAARHTPARSATN